MQKKYISRNMINDSRFVNLFNTYDSVYKNQILCKMDKFIRDSSYTDDKNYPHLANIFSAMAIYLSLIEEGNSKEDSLNIIKNSMYDFIEDKKKNMQKISSMPGFINIIKFLFPKISAKTFGTGWEINFPKCNKDEFAFTTVKCIYAEIFSIYNVEELGPIFCHVDDIVYGNLPKISFSYTQTICRGGSFCDYKFSKVKKCSVSKVIH